VNATERCPAIMLEGYLLPLNRRPLDVLFSDRASDSLVRALEMDLRPEPHAKHILEAVTETHAHNASRGRVGELSGLNIYSRVTSAWSPRPTPDQKAMQ